MSETKRSSQAVHGAGGGNMSDLKSAETQPAVYFGRTTDFYLRQWLGLDSWNSGHPLDEARFFRFLKVLNTYARPDRYGISKAEPSRFRQILRRVVLERQPNRDNSSLQATLDRCAATAGVVYHYEQACRRDWPTPPYVQRAQAASQKWPGPEIPFQD
jgi:hypothetical protein